MSSIKVRSKNLNDKTELRILIAHEMKYPTQFIRLLTVTCNKKVVLTIELGENTPKNPFFAFILKQVKSGDEITVNWLDNMGNSEMEQHIIN